MQRYDVVTYLQMKETADQRGECDLPRLTQLANIMFGSKLQMFQLNIQSLLVVPQSAT